MDEVVRIALWSGPRNISTTMMYSFAQRNDTSVVDEPLFGHFLNFTGAWRPSREEVLTTMDTNAGRIIREELYGNHASAIYFMKHMANHLEGLDWEFARGFQNIILTRHPASVLPSYAVHIKAPTMLDVGYEIQGQFFNQLLAWGEEPIVLDAAEVLKNPQSVLQQLCDRLSISFDESMLHWKPGPRPEDGVWAKYWYKNLHKSSGFAPYQKREEPVPTELMPLYESCLPHYQRLSKYAIRG